VGERCRLSSQASGHREYLCVTFSSVVLMPCLNDLPFSSSRMHVMNHSWSATKQRLHPQSVANISRHSVLSSCRESWWLLASIAAHWAQSAASAPDSLAALFYSPVDFTDASDLHQTVVKFIG